ncbi:YlbF family regulator [Clostridium ganghwense]|uniref:YlbF family regulator n=1 Tax=Clostridium ganghwense TaxID=312089 RepID=UPI002342F665|nr:YlbF family regulator [Clostridium ganghwense]
MKKGEISKGTKEKLQNMGSVVSMNPVVNEYLQAEARFGMLWEDIMKILNDSIGINLSLGNEK